jgi:hypothetical protein
MLVFQPTAITNDHRSMIGNVVEFPLLVWDIRQKDVPLIQLGRPSFVLELVRVRTKVAVYMGRA